MRENTPPEPDVVPAGAVRRGAVVAPGGVVVAVVSPGGSSEVADGATGPLDPGSLA